MIRNPQELCSNNRSRSPHLELAKLYWKSLLATGGAAIDATCGNGHDTLFLASLPITSLLSIDIQEAAIEKTRLSLKANLSEEAQKRVSLLLASHEDFRKLPLPEEVRLIVYNLGYLPGGDKSITTQTASTLASIESALLILEKDGAVSIACYPGHGEGKREEDALLDFAAKLSSNEWEVRHHRWINRPLSPNLFWIVRIASSIR